MSPSHEAAFTKLSYRLHHAPETPPLEKSREGIPIALKRIQQRSFRAVA